MHPLQVEHPFAMDRLNDPDDFRVEWDVPSLGKAFTDALSRDIDRVRTRPAPDPERKVHLFAGSAGYGKTHLFGRVRHQQGDRFSLSSSRRRKARRTFTQSRSGR